MKISGAILRNITISLAIAAVAMMGAAAHAQAQGQAQPQPCPVATTSRATTATPNSTANTASSSSKNKNTGEAAQVSNEANQVSNSVTSTANSAESAMKSLGGLFHKKKAAVANANPCAPAATPASAPVSGAPTPSSAARRNATASPAPAANSTGINWDKPFTPPADVKIDVTQMAPFSQGTPFYVSPHGTHVATPSHAGSRVQMIYDGVAGPVFDSFATGGSSVVSFSADGSHYGYCGVSGDHFSVMVDGKEVGTSNQLEADHFDCKVLFSPNSKHFYYISHAGPDVIHVHARFVIDGKAELDFGDLQPQNLVFSPDGEHFAAVLYPYPPGKPMELVVDGKISSWPGGSPIWSADSQHLFTMGQSGKTQTLYRDGKPVMTASNIRLASQPISIGLTAPPAGDTPVAIAHNSNNGVGGVLKEQWYLAMNGKQIPGTLLEKTGGGGAAQILNLMVSNDGKHYAAIFNGANGKQYLFGDGKRGQYYDGINPTTVQFTSGTFQPIYVATNGGAQYLIVGDQETAVPNIGSIIIGPGGDHVATEGDGGVIDGKPLNLSGANPLNTQVSGFSFTPDGNHYGYLARGRNGITLYVDGVPDTAHTWIVPATVRSLWTAGSNIVYLCGSTNPGAANQYGLCFDGKYGYLGPRPIFNNFTLTPDASHIFFYAGIAQGGFRLFLDGVPLLENFPMAPSGFPAGTWEMEPDGRLQILAQDNTGIKRYTITPSSSTSFAALVGGATTATAANQ
jgi:hypothetical protein